MKEDQKAENLHTQNQIRLNPIHRTSGKTSLIPFQMERTVELQKVQLLEASQQIRLMAHDLQVALVLLEQDQAVLHDHQDQALLILENELNNV